MQRHLLLDFIEKRITLKIYATARELEKDLSPDHFTAYFARGSIVFWVFIFAFFVLATLCFSLIENVLFYILLAGAIGSFFVVLYHISYRCIVNDTGITVRKFWFMEKQIFWKDVKKIETREVESYGKAPEKHAIIRNKQNKMVYSCSYELVGFTLIVNKAKREHRKPH